MPSANETAPLLPVFSDGLTVPFALTAGLSSLGNTKLVILGGLAELFSGMISIRLDTYLAAATKRQHWEAEHARECEDIENIPNVEQLEILELLEDYRISRAAAEPVASDLCANEDNWIRFMMDFQLHLEEPDVYQV